MTHIVDPQSFTKGKHFPVNNCHPLTCHKYRNSDFKITIQYKINSIKFNLVKLNLTSTTMK